MDISEKKCIPCDGELSPLAEEEVHSYLKNVSGWVVDKNNKSIAKKFNFKNFANALDFVNDVGKIAEAKGHHPDISFGWGYCNITLQTHSIGGLHQNDFIVAAKINKICV